MDGADQTRAFDGLEDLSPRRSQPPRKLPDDGTKATLQKLDALDRAFVRDLDAVYRKHHRALHIDYEQAARDLNDIVRQRSYDREDITAEDLEEITPLQVVPLEDLPRNDHPGARLCLMSDGRVDWE